MSDHLLLYSDTAAHSDDTIYPPTAAETTDAAKDPALRLRRPKPRPGSDDRIMAPGVAAGSGPGARSSSSRSQHRRSVSLLSRLRHPGAPSPAGSPTSSEGSSRDTRSDRTLAHTASSGSMRNQAHRHPAHHDAAASDKEPHHRPAVRVLPPPNDADLSTRKRASLRGNRPGFISQLLRGQQRSPRQAEPQPVRHYARSPGTPRSHRSAGSQSPASLVSAAAAAAEGDDPHHRPGPEHYHGHCHYGQPVASHHEFGHPDLEPNGPEHIMHDGYAVCGGPDGIYYVNSGPPGPSHLAAAAAAAAAAADRQDADSGGRSGMDPYGPGGGWYGEGDMHTAGRLVSSLPVYEPIDMGRYQAQHNNYVRATRPVLPDARMLAPMASLADVYESGGMGDYGALSNRELRFAVENHMLVEQHRYLIRDLGHARSAISALKQVVQAKEDRCDHFEAVNVELQQRVAVLESILTGDQRRQLAGLPYTFAVAAGEHPGLADDDAGSSAQREALAGGLQATDDSGSCCSSGSSISDDDAGRTRGGPPLPLAEAHAERKHAGRPLSGYATGFSFSERPVHQLPRVFSGDYSGSSSEVQAMETSVEALASAITAIPRDADSVEDIIASKMPSSADLQPGDGPASPATAKRRSRFFAVLRRPSRTAASSGEHAAKSKRRSVSLGNGVALRDHPPPLPAADAPGLDSGRGHMRAGSHGSLAASCPVLTAAPRAQQQQPAQRQASGSRYPAGLGLSDSESSTGASREPSVGGHGSLESMATRGSGQRKVSQRMSLSAQPRRSTSAPSRPHSMRVSSRRSWLLQLFGGRGAGDEPGAALAAAANEEVDSADELDEFAGALGRRRRVMTQSSDEISRFLGRLRLEDPPRRATGTAAGGALEGVVDVSGEDEERASRPSLSVSEVRQQTLDALNGTLRGGTRPPPGDPRSPPVLPAESGGDVGLDPASGRWRQRDTAGATIRRLSPASPASGSSAASLGRGQRSQSWAQGCDAPEDDETDGSGKRWAPPFWAPQPLAVHASSAAQSPGAATANTWSPRGSSDSGRRGSEDARFRSPRGSMRGSGGSPWELVRLPDSRNFPLSPGRSGSPPPIVARALAFFEDSAVPDSDELTAAAAAAVRRSLSLRMSHTSFRQAEPLPESEDAYAAEDDVDGRSTSILTRATGGESRALSPRNPALARVAQAAQPKRRSLLRQLAPRTARAAPAARAPDDHPSPALPTVDDDPPPPATAAAEAEAPPPSARRTKKWWLAVLG